jgi:hypothetical protein
LASRIIDSGYRAMAKSLHPDAGGSNDAMLELNQARDALRRGF